MTLLRKRFAAARGEDGLTLIELLVASAIGVIVLGGISTMVVAAMKTQPEVNKRAENISTARWELERLTRELRNGVLVETATPTEVSFRTYVRRTACGSNSALSSTSPAIQCKVTYTCTTTSCSRSEVPPESTEPGTTTTIVSGIDDANVFSYSPNAEEPTYVGITLHIPNPSGPADLTVSDGASLRNATLAN